MNDNTPFINSKYNYQVNIPKSTYLLLHPLSSLKRVRFIDTEGTIYGNQIGLSADKYDNSTFSEYVSSYPNRILADGPCGSIEGKNISKEEDFVINNIDVKRIYVNQRVERCDAETIEKEIGPIYIYDISNFNNGTNVALILSQDKNTGEMTDADLEILEEISKSIQAIE